MNMRTVALALVVAVAAVVPATSWGANLSGTWVASPLGSRVEAHVQQKGHAVKGVAYVHSPLGKKDTYHFQGTVKGNQVVASHYSGHVFSGNLNSPNEVVGVLKTRSGHRIGIHASRR
jgi:hypothetical protein